MSSPTTLADSALQPMVDKLDYHFKLSDADRLAVASLPATVNGMDRMQFIVREGDCASHSCVLLEGTAVRSKYVNRGCRQICSIHIRGEVVDLQNSLLTVADHCVEMITPGLVALIRARQSSVLHSSGRRSARHYG